jgi:hypothetical protein
MNMCISQVYSVKKEGEAYIFLRRIFLLSILFILETISVGVASTTLSSNYFGSGMNEFIKDLKRLYPPQGQIHSIKISQ